MTMTENINTDDTATQTFNKGTWQDALNKSSLLLNRVVKDKKRAGALLWDGAKNGIEEWLPNADNDVSAEGFYAEVVGILGSSRKGDASKIKTVAMAVKNNGLNLGSFPNLSTAYAEAVKITKTVKVQAAEDDAAEKAVEALTIPNSTTTVEGAALIVLSKGIDGAVVALLDALGATNHDAHRSFLRSVSTEIAARVQAAKPKPTPKVKATPKAKGEAKPAGDGAAKAKPVPVSKSKGDPNKKALPAKAKPVQRAKPVKSEVIGEENTPAVEAPVEAPAPAKAKPVQRAKPVRR